MQTPETEDILVIPTRQIRCYLKEGFFTSDSLLREVLTARQWLPRTAELEENPEWKQPIGYSVISAPSGVLVYERAKKGGESRLHGDWSMAFGGHCKSPLSHGEGQRLEVYGEELIWPEGYSVEDNIVGFVNFDHAEPVHAVHLGVVHVIKTAQDYVLKCPKEERGKIRIIGYLDRADLERNAHKFERWSRALIESREFTENLHGAAAVA